jgi:hypothetical protein
MDTSKIVPPLLTLPMQQDENGRYWGYAVCFKEIYFLDIFQNRHAFDIPAPTRAILDTGSTLMHLPKKMVEALAKSLNGYVGLDGILVVLCHYRVIRQAGGIIFDTGVGIFEIPWTRLVDRVRADKDGRMCTTYIQGEEKLTMLKLGMPFYQASYVIHDLVISLCLI